MNYHQLKSLFEKVDNQRKKEQNRISWPTQMGYYIPSSLTHMHQAFEYLFKKNLIQKGQLFLDAGSGDGRITALASLHGLAPFGIEHDDYIFQQSRLLTKDWQNIKLSQGNFLLNKTYHKLGKQFAEFPIIYNFANSCLELAEKIANESPKGTLFLFYDTSARRTEFPGLIFIETLKLTDKDAEDNRTDLPLIIDYLHIHKK